MREGSPGPHFTQGKLKSHVQLVVRESGPSATLRAGKTRHQKTSLPNPGQSWTTPELGKHLDKGRQSWTTLPLKEQGRTAAASGPRTVRNYSAPFSPPRLIRQTKMAKRIKGDAGEIGENKKGGIDCTTNLYSTTHSLIHYSSIILVSTIIVSSEFNS